VPRPELRARILVSLPASPARPNPATLRRAVPRLAMGGTLAALGLVAAFAMTHLPGRPGHVQVAVTLPPKPHNSIRNESRPATEMKTAPGALEGLASKPLPTRDPFSTALLRKVIPPPPQQDAQRTPGALPEGPRGGWEFVPRLPQKPKNAPAPDTLDFKRPVQLALVVQDTDTLYQRLQAQVEKQGGRIVSLRSDGAGGGSEKSPVPKNTAPPSGPENASVPQHGNVLTLQVPVGHARALLHALKQLGAVLPASAISSSSAGHSAMPQPSRAPSSSEADAGPSSRPENDTFTDKTAPARLQPAASDKAENGSATIVLRLYRRLDAAH